MDIGHVAFQISLRDEPGVIIYRNDVPNSAHACRPIRLSYERETSDTIRVELDHLQQQVAELQAFSLPSQPTVKVFFNGLLTMIDGKVLNELMNNPASSSCPICHRTYRQIAKPDGDFVPKEGALEYGASVLHFGIRAFDALCAIGYRQDVKKSRMAYTQDEKQRMADRERCVKAQFLDKLGLVVDQRRDGGAGNTTTGNVARKAFENAGMLPLRACLCLS